MIRFVLCLTAALTIGLRPSEPTFRGSFSRQADFRHTYLAD